MCLIINLWKLDSHIIFWEREMINLQPPNKILGLIVLFILSFSFESHSGADTTKGDTRLIPKEKESTEEINSQNQKSNRRHDTYLNDSDKDNENLFSCVMGEVFSFLFTEPVKALFNTDLIIDNFSRKKIRLGFGASILDFSLYPKASFSYSIKFNGDILFTPNEFISIREHLGIHISPIGGFLSDFERDVYANGNPVGVEKDKGDFYYNFSFPLNTEFMVRPAGANGSFFFLIGGGPRYVYEKFEGIREYSYQNSKDSITISDGNWIPTLSFGIGRLIELGGPFSSFEIRYSIGINRNEKKISLPGENTKYVHGFTLIQYQIFF